MIITADITNDEIKKHLEKILGHKSFASSPVLRDILGYVVTEEIEGRGANIKAYTIAVDALGRDTKFDAQTDPTVRVSVGRLRKLLVLYYANQGASDDIRIVMTKGTYRPIICRAHEVLNFTSEIDYTTRFGDDMSPDGIKFRTLVAGCSGFVLGYLACFVISVST